MADIENNQDNSAGKDTVSLHTLTRLNTIKHGHLGPILAVLIVVLLLVFVGLVLWGDALNKTAEEIERSLINNEPETTRANVDTDLLNTTSPSDELDAIEADLSATNLDMLDADMTAIESEFNTAPSAQQ